MVDTLQSPDQVVVEAPERAVAARPGRKMKR